MRKITNFLKEQGYCKEFHYQTPSAKEFCSIFNVCTQCIHFSLTCITAAIKKIVAVCSNWPSGFYITLKISRRRTQKGEQDSVPGEGTAGATLLIFKCLKRSVNISQIRSSRHPNRRPSTQNCRAVCERLPQQLTFIACSSELGYEMCMTLGRMARQSCVVEVYKTTAPKVPPARRKDPWPLQESE